MTGLFVTQLADGIMGMSSHTATLPKQLYDRKLLEHNMFAMCYRRELGTSKRGVTAGSMTLGGVSNNLDTSPMVRQELVKIRMVHGLREEYLTFDRAAGNRLSD
jgi:hypothetical protein